MTSNSSQRALVCLLLLTAASCGRPQNENPPAFAIRIQPPALAPAARAIRFTEAEAALAEIEVNASGEVQLDSATEAALSKAAGDLPVDITGPGAQRVWLLVRKAFPGNSGQQLADLLERYGRYRSALPPQTNIDNDPAVELAWLDAAERLQAQYFAENAQALFGQQNALVRYTLELRRLELDTTLDPSARKARLQALRQQLDRAAAQGNH